MNRTKYDIFLKNILFLSSLAQYNSERRQLVLKFYDVALKNRTLFKESITLKDVKKFCLKNRMLIKDPKTMKEVIIQDNVLTIPGSVSLGRNFGYITARYSHLDRSFLKKYGFHVVSLGMMEKVLIEIVYSKAHFLGIFDEVYRFRNKSEYANPCFLVEPDFTFQNKWNACITISERELLDAYVENQDRLDAYYRAVSSIKWKIGSPEELEKLWREEAENILKQLCIDLELDKIGISHPFLKPLIKTCHNNDSETHYIAPFPYVLGSTTQFRLENCIQNSREISEIEEKSKGEVVEFLAKQILALFPNKNIIKNYRYRIDKKIYESDVILLLDKSLWVVEVKSHPIFKKIPLQASKILPIFIDKTREGLEQGKRTLDFLKTQRRTLFNLGYTKSFKKLIKGIIVAFDGFIPTLLTLNEKLDELFGTIRIYEKIPEGTRVYVATLLDLYFLYTQPDVQNFEDFLIWRTNYIGRFPIVSFDETEYWAFFNDRYIKDRAMKEAFLKCVKEGISISYISARFNVKDYLEKIVKQDVDIEEERKSDKTREEAE